MKCRFRVRFSLRTMLVLPLLVGAIWWWHSWPHRTANRFARLLDQGDAAAARAMLASDFWDRSRQHVPGFKEIPSSVGWNWGIEQAAYGSPILRPRTLRDWCLGRVEFGLPTTAHGSITVYGNLRAAGGAIHFVPNDWQGFPLFCTIPLKHITAEAAMQQLDQKAFRFAPSKPMHLSGDGNQLQFRGSKQDHVIVVDVLKQIDLPGPR